MRVLLDTNVWLAILTTDGFCRRMWRDARQRCTIVSADVILAEIEEKLRVKFDFSERHAALLTLFVQRQTANVDVVSVVSACADADDNPILAAAADGECLYLVTGDSDLLTLREFQKVQIVTPRAFADSALK